MARSATGAARAAAARSSPASSERYRLLGSVPAYTTDSRPSAMRRETATDVTRRSAMPCQASRQVSPPSAVAYRPSSNVPTYTRSGSCGSTARQRGRSDREHGAGVVRAAAGQREAHDLVAGHDEDARRAQALALRAFARALVGHPEQLDRAVRLVGRADRDGDPAGIGEHVVRAGAAFGDQLIAHAPRERKVGDPVAVKVAELAPAQAELDASEPVRRGFHARPRLHGSVICSPVVMPRRLGPRRRDHQT